MPASCGIVGCTARGKQSKFFSIPKVLNPEEVSYIIDTTRQKLSKKRNSLWLAAINRKDLLNNSDRLRAFLKNGRVCARHFYSGKPAALLDPDNVDWVPRLHLGYGKPTNKIIKEIERELQTQQKERLLRLEKQMPNCASPVEPLAIYMPSDELAVQSCETVYECGFCTKKFNKISAINDHIKSQHGNTVQTVKITTTTRGKSARQMLIDLLQRLVDFEWSDCGDCEAICQQFCESFEQHVSSVHNAVDMQPLSGSQHHAQKLAPLFTHTQRGGRLKCSVCRTNTQDYGALLDHFKAHMPEIKKPADLLQMFKPKIQDGEALSKKVLFKIRREGDVKVYVCTVCKARLHDRDEMLGHFKTHLNKKELPTDDKRKELPESPPLPIQETVLDKQRQVLVELTEYQCAVCADVDYTRTKILKCLKKHVQNGWPKLINAGLVWEALSNAATDEVSELDVQADGPEVTVVTEPPNIEESLEQIELHCNQLTNVADVAVEERTFYYCPACQQYFDMYDEFRRHLSQLHGQYDDVTGEHVVGVQSLIKCLNCKMDSGDHLMFGDIKAAFLHRHQKHFFEFEKPSDQSVKRYVINPDETEVLATGKLRYFVKNCIAEDFQCPCGKVFDFKSMALNCLAKHVGLRRYQCDIPTARNLSGKCGVKFFTSHDLERHIRKVHQQGHEDDNAKKVICHICGNSFLRGRILAHMKNKHATEKKNCPICGKILINESRLTAHIRLVHNKTKAVRCKGCFKMWPDTTAARDCQAMHNNVYAASKPPKKSKFECEFCNFTTISAKLLQKHVEEHKVDDDDGNGEDESESSMVEYSD